MNKITCDFPSLSLKEQAQVTVLLPKHRPSPFFAETAPVFDRFKTLYLLHGAFESAETWLWNSGIAGLVDALNLAVVLPNGGNSFYLDEPDGPGYYSYISQELPEYLQHILPLSSDREDTFIGGLSMGGYGAVFAALNRPERFGKAFAMSGALEIGMAAGFVKAGTGSVPYHLRDRKALKDGPFDLIHLLDAVEPEKMPPILLTCGESDFFYRNSVAFYEKAEKRGLRTQLVSAPGGHNWEYWNNQLAGCLNWLLVSEQMG